MDPQALTLILMIAGIALIFAEFFLPSGGIIAVSCVLCFLGSIFTAYRAWGESQPHFFWMYVGSLFVIIPGSVYGAFQILLRTPLGDRVFLPIPKKEDTVPHEREVDRLRGFIGKRGRALSLMSPGGMVIVDGVRLHAVTESIMIQPNTEIEVSGVQGTVVVVHPYVPESAAPALEIGGDNLASAPAEESSSEATDLNPFD
ncbi:MAG: NfeD family protein [Planctomycetaceae bacterium]